MNLSDGFFNGTSRNLAGFSKNVCNEPMQHFSQISVTTLSFYMGKKITLNPQWFGKNKVWFLWGFGVFGLVWFFGGVLIAMLKTLPLQ